MALVKDYPSFSVLMSVYKRDNPRYLDIALDSIEQQTIKPNEIVLVEDGPVSEKIQSVINEHIRRSTIQFKNIKLKKNNGLGKALQIGTEYVSNNWIARMDSDDISVPNRFEKQLNEIKKKPNLAIVGGQVSEFVGNVNNIVGYRKVPINNDSIKRFVKWRSPFNHPTVMINKKKLKEVGGYRSFGNVEDYYLWVRFIIEKFEVCNLAEVLTLMRVDEGLYSRRGNTKNLVFFYKLRKIMKKNKIISYKEEVLGNILITANILLPETLRKFFYQYFLHSKIGRKNKIK